MKSNQFTAQGIVLNRTNFGEADRILTFLTSNHGKLKVMAKGVRKSGAKLAGSIELFSISDLTLIAGRRDIATLISARLVKHYGNIVKDINRTTLGYEQLRLINKATEDQPEPAYFELLNQGLVALDELDLDADLIMLWFEMKLLKLTGHMPNLHTNSAGEKLADSKNYNVNFEQMSLEPASGGQLSVNHIKFIRLGFRAGRPQTIHRINDAANLAVVCMPIIQSMLKSHLRI